jgi:hypothetical protein
MSPGHPLIDPEVTKLVDLPDLPAGFVARAIWQERVQELAAMTAALRAERELNGFESMVTLAVGVLPESLDGLAADLQSNIAAVVVAATAKVNQDLCMTVDTFNRLMAIRTKDSDPSAVGKPTAGEWSDAYQIVTSAQKQKQSYRTWISKEAGRQSRTGTL